MTSPEFIFLNDQAARVTSLVENQASGGFALVVIARGGADRDHLLDLLNADDLQIRLDSGPSRTMRTTEIDIRSVGSGPQANHRIRAVLEPLDEMLPEPATPPPPSEPASSMVEHKLDQIIELLTDIRNRLNEG